MKRDIDVGGDPVAERKEVREAPTVADLCEKFESEYLPRKRANTADGCRRQIRLYILPAIGSRKVASITFDDMDKLHRTITARGAPAMANRTLATASRLFAMAAKWQMRPENQNPCKGIEHNQENKRHRYLTDDEAERLTAAPARLKDQESANALRLLMLTGARKSEVLKARWDQFDLKRGTWTKPGSTTKQKTDHHVPLSGPALELLRGLGGGPGFVFPRLAGHTKGDVRLAWRRLLLDAGITDLHVHDLRHHFASVLASSGHSLPIIGALLGHSQPATTARYAHLVNDALKSAVERAGAIITGK